MTSEGRTRRQRVVPRCTDVRPMFRFTAEDDHVLKGMYGWPSLPYTAILSICRGRSYICKTAQFERIKKTGIEWPGVSLHPHSVCCCLFVGNNKVSVNPRSGLPDPSCSLSSVNPRSGLPDPSCSLSSVNPWSGLPDPSCSLSSVNPWSGLPDPSCSLS